MKRIILILGLICISLLTGCSSNNENNNSDNENRIEIVETKFQPIEEYGIDGYKEEPIDLDKYSVENKYNNDAKTNYSDFRLASSEHGYYYCLLNKINFFDKNAKVAVPLCNRPDCTHSGEDCNAYYNDNMFGGDIGFVNSYIQYYDGYLYMIATEMSGNVYLYRISEDGSVREQYMNLYKQEFTKSEEDGSLTFRAPKVCIHRGYVYYYIPFQKEPAIRRKKLGGSEEEIIFEINGVRPELYRMRPYGDFLFFQAGNFIDDTYTYINAGVFAYNVNNGKLQLIKKDAFNYYYVENGKLYYIYKNGINELDLESMKCSTIIEMDERPSFSTDGKYIYIQGKDCIITYSLSGEYIDTIILNDANQSIHTYLFSDGDFYFAGGINYVEEERKSGFYYFKIEDIETNEAEWNFIY